MNWTEYEELKLPTLCSTAVEVLDQSGNPYSFTRASFEWTIAEGSKRILVCQLTHRIHGSKVFLHETDRVWEQAQLTIGNWYDLRTWRIRFCNP